MKNLYLLEPQADAPLVISFAFNILNEEPQPYLRSELQALEITTGKPVSKLFLQDQRCFWYTQGADGLGSTFEETVEQLRSVIARLNPTSVTMVGEAMGAYAAMMYGAVMGVDSVIAFAPISAFCSDLALEFGDRRYYNKMRESLCYLSSPTTDVAAMTNHYAMAGRFAVIYGTRPPMEHIDATGLDALHAWRIKSYFPTAELFAHSDMGHLVAHQMRSKNMLQPFLQERIAGWSSSIEEPPSRQRPQVLARNRVAVGAVVG